MFNVLQFFQENNGSFSSTRGVMLSWCLGVLGIWGYLCIHKDTLLEIPDSVIAIIVVLVTGKYFSKKVEVAASDECAGTTTTTTLTETKK